MKELKIFAAAVLMLFLLFITAGIAQNGKPAADETLYQTGQIIKPKAGISWREQVEKQRSIKRRAAEKRNAAKRDAMLGLEEQLDKDVTIKSYNAMIMKKNAKESKQQ